MKIYLAPFGLYFYFRYIGNIKTISLHESNGARKCTFRTRILTSDFVCQNLSSALIQCIPLLGIFSNLSSCICLFHRLFVIKVVLRDNISS